MNRIIILLLLVVVATGRLSVTAQAPAERKSNFLAALKRDQPVSIKEVSGRYEISTVDGAAAVQGHKVVEIGADYVIVQDISGVTEIHIPMYSIKAIIQLKFPGK